MVGETVSHYKILEKLGQGGMGVVYRAEDVRLGRTVALKFLSQHLLGDDASRKRFELEARVAATLVHPNLCTVHEIGEADGKTYIAMAFVEGESLDKKIARGPLPLDEALAIAQQVAKGLAAAHRREIAHRDIKPENIIVGEDGHATIMDFGLARLAGASRLTRTDEALGTVAYMSPEQTEGSGADRRTDVWSLGVVLYEMITGQRPFGGEYDKAIVYSILNESYEPPTGLRTGVPMELESCIAKCLEKSPEDRYQSMDELLVDLRRIAVGISGRGRTSVIPAGRPAEPSARLPWLPWALAALGLALAAAAWLGRPPNEAPPGNLRRFVLDTEPVVNGAQRRAAISPDGRHVAFVAGGIAPALWVRRLDSEEARQLAALSGPTAPFWSPDSARVAYVSGGELLKVPASGGAPSLICKLPGLSYLGGTWSRDGESIAFASGTGGPGRLYQAPAVGGVATPLIESDADQSGRGIFNPHFLPSSRHLLFDTGGRADRTLVIRDLDTGTETVLGDGAKGFYSATGHILYQTGSWEAGIWALPFSLESMEALGPAVPIVEGGSDPSASADGLLAWVDFAARPSQQLFWVNREGDVLETCGHPQLAITSPHIHPDGTRVIAAGLEEGNQDLWLHEIGRQLKQRLTVDPGTETFPLWSPSGNRILFGSTRSGNVDIYIRGAAADAPARPVVATPHVEWPDDWSPDGSRFVYHVVQADTGSDIWIARSIGDEGEFRTRPLVQTPFIEQFARISRDGKWLAYQSDKSGQTEVFVRSLDGVEEELQVSSGGGMQPRWSDDELFYLAAGQLRAASIETEPRLRVAASETLWPHAGVDGATYDVTPDGQRFIVVREVDSGRRESARVHIVENWW